MKKKTGLILVVAFLLGQARCFSQPSFEQQRFERLTSEYGTVSYSAWLSVMHRLSNELSAEMNGLYDVTQFPLEYALQFTDAQRVLIKRETIDYLHLQSDARKTLLFRRAEFWMLAWQQWNICTKLTSIEETVAVLYEMDPDRAVFQYVIKNRGFKKEDVTGASLASSMSSAELSGMEYELLDDWSVSSREKILSTFSKLFMKLNQ